MQFSNCSKPWRSRGAVCTLLTASSLFPSFWMQCSLLGPAPASWFLVPTWNGQGPFFRGAVFCTPDQIGASLHFGITSIFRRFCGGSSPFNCNDCHFGTLNRRLDRPFSTGSWYFWTGPWFHCCCTVGAFYSRRRDLSIRMSCRTPFGVERPSFWFLDQSSLFGQL